MESSSEVSYNQHPAGTTALEATEENPSLSTLGGNATIDASAAPELSPSKDIKIKAGTAPPTQPLLSEQAAQMELGLFLYSKF